MNITDSDDFYLISGITGSIGEAIAVKLISRGCNVIGISRNKVNSTLKSKYPRISWFEYDLSEDDINNESIKKLQEIIGGKKLQAVYHCAGMHSKGKPLKLKQNEYIEPLKANLISSVNAVKLSIDLIKPGGSIFILNSQAAISASAEELAYGISKRALSSYIDGMQQEATKRNLQLVNVLPGAVQSNMAKGRDNYEKFIDASELAELLISLSRTGSSIRIKDIELLRRNY